MEGSEGSLFAGKAALLSIGPESDELVAVLDDLYGTRTGACVMRKQISVTAVGLLSDPRLIETQPVRMKIFFNANAEDESTYAEAYLNVLLQSGVLQFHEKGEDYRRPLIRALAED